MIRSTCLPDSGIRVENTNLPGWEILAKIRHSKPVLLCPYTHLTALTDLLKGRQTNTGTSCVFSFYYFFSLFYLLTSGWLSHTELVPVVTCRWFFLCSMLKMPLKHCSRTHIPSSACENCSDMPWGRHRNFRIWDFRRHFHTYVTTIHPQVTVPENRARGNSHSSPSRAEEVSSKNQYQGLHKGFDNQHVWKRKITAPLWEEQEKHYTQCSGFLLDSLWDSLECGTRSASTAQNDSTKQTGNGFLTVKTNQPKLHCACNTQSFLFFFPTQSEAIVLCLCPGSTSVIMWCCSNLTSLFFCLSQRKMPLLFFPLRLISNKCLCS